MTEAYIGSWVDCARHERYQRIEREHLARSYDFRGRGFTAIDVVAFLDSVADELEPANLAADKPFDNHWHGGSWRDEALPLLRMEAEIYDLDHREYGAFLDAVGTLAFQRGYDIGMPRIEIVVPPDPEDEPVVFDDD